jgi:hypothetical protein
MKVGAGGGRRRKRKEEEERKGQKDEGRRNIQIIHTLSVFGSHNSPDCRSHQYRSANRKCLHKECKQ